MATDIEIYAFSVIPKTAAVSTKCVTRFLLTEMGNCWCFLDLTSMASFIRLMTSGRLRAVGNRPTTTGSLNTQGESKDRRNEVIGGQQTGQNMVIDEEAPASFRKKGDPVITKPTSASRPPAVLE